MDRDKFLPEWLAERDNYEPLLQKNRFIDRNIRTLQRILLIMQKVDEPEGFLAAIQAIVKLPIFVLMILLASLSHSFDFLLIFLAVELIFLCLSPIKLIEQCLTAGLAAALFMFISLIPAELLRYHPLFYMLMIKSWLTVTLSVMLVAATRRDELIAALRVFRVPNIFILVLNITINYIVVFARCALSMFYAIRVRTVGRSRVFHHSFAGIGGTLFFKSQMLSQTLFDAMCCRGFTGAYRSSVRFDFHWADGLFIGAALIITSCFFII